MNRIFKIVLISAVAFFATVANAQVSWKETIQIYENLIKKNNLKRPEALYIVYNKKINGWATPEYKIAISNTALLHLDKQSMAALLAHELAHLQMYDPYYYIPGKFKEDRADYFGRLYAEQAGYNRCKMAELFKHFYRQSGNNGGSDDTHSSNLKRYWRYFKGCK